MLPLRRRVDSWVNGHLNRYFGKNDHVFTYRMQRCWNCNRFTHFIDVSFETPLHPGYCTDQKNKEFFDALLIGDMTKLIDDLRLELLERITPERDPEAWDVYWEATKCVQHQWPDTV